MSSRCHAIWLSCLLSWAFAPAAHAETVRFAVVNLSPQQLPVPVIEEAEREYARLRPGASAPKDPTLRRLLATGETPKQALPRLLAGAYDRRKHDDCAEAIPLAVQAEELALSAVPADEARDPLKRIYSLIVDCEEKLGRAEERDRAARHLRALVSSAPEDLPLPLWEAYVQNALPPNPENELLVDSEPVNAQVILNFHALGPTPRTLKLPPGEVLLEIQKTGYKKAFRRLTAGERPKRITLRLEETRKDRVELAAAALQIIEQDPALEQNQRTLAQLAQQARVDTLLLLRADAGRLVIRIFDAERGEVTQAKVVSTFDPQTGRIEAFASQPTPGSPVSAGAPPATRSGPRQQSPTTAELISRVPSEAEDAARLNAAGKGPPPRKKPDTGAGPWWGWLIAAAVAGGIAAAVISDQPRRSDTINVNAQF